MPQPLSINPFTTPFLQPGTNVISREWWKFLFSLNRNSSQAASGEVSTLPGSGLQGGGLVADGIDLSIAANGVTNAMIRQGLATSVIGRFQGSGGNVADIQAMADNQLLGRFGGQLVFKSISAIPSVVGDGDYGDVTVSGSGTIWTIDNTVVTYAKMQNVSAASRLLGRGSAAGAGSPEEITLGSGLTLTGTVLSATGTGGTVTTVSVVTANGVSGSVADPTTTPAITLTLGAITPSSVAASGTVTGSNLSGTNTGDQTITLTGDVTGSGTGSFAATLATVNTDVGSFGSASAVPVITVNGKGLITAVSTAALGTIATQNANAVAITGGSGAFTSALSFTLNQNATTTFAVTNTNTASSASRGQITVQGGTVSMRWLGISGDSGYLGTTSASDLFLQRNSTNIVQVKSTGIDVTGESRCDSFRIDQTPTAETVVCTHTLTISVNGTNYKIPIVAA